MPPVTGVTGDISAYSKNGKLAVTDNTAAGTIGVSPEIFIELETRNGDIKVSK